VHVTESKKLRDKIAESFIIHREFVFTLGEVVFAESTILSSRRRILLSEKPRFPIVVGGGRVETTVLR
jgi:hypothetical protein